ncbi:MAG TPA: Rieske (2Fe-2S) protein [Pseudonocardiaceae bacterium]|jgi:Rieske Fe-S protein|nr:Rieske (2Fe-2S) protein [Pseudonocardiaceae bacterium]
MTAPTDPTADGELSRRRMMRNAAITGTVVAAGAALAACGSSDSSGYGGGSASTGGNAAGGTSAGGSGGGASSGGVLAKTSDIPVGEGKIFADKQIVVTQPAAGTYKAFSSTCTHLGCTVDKVADGLIQCPCHGSKFSVADGSVKDGPAPKPLPSQNITVQGTDIIMNS